MKIRKLLAFSAAVNILGNMFAVSAETIPEKQLPAETPTADELYSDVGKNVVKMLKKAKKVLSAAEKAEDNQAPSDEPAETSSSETPEDKQSLSESEQSSDETGEISYSEEPEDNPSAPENSGNDKDKNKDKKEDTSESKPSEKPKPDPRPSEDENSFAIPADGLNVSEDGIYYISNGRAVKNKWITEGEDIYFFGSDGKALTGRNIIRENEYTFDENGIYIGCHIMTDYVDSSDMYTYDELEEDLALLKEHYPEIFDYDSIGTTYDGRKIFHAVIGDPNAEKQIVIAASCHAREYMTSLLVMDMAEYCLNGYYTASYSDIEYKKLLGEYSIHIIPMLNPDGVTISQFGPDGLKDPRIREYVRGLYKKAVNWGYTTADEERYYRRWKANARGIDLNRNFDAKWNIIETLRGPVGVNYKGSSPESEIESQSIVKFLSELDNPVTIISYHATGSMIYWDYGQKGDLRKRSEEQISLVKAMTGYVALSYSEYSAGGLSDYVIASGMNAVPETIEIGKSEAPVDMSEYNGIWEKNKRLIPMLAYLYRSEELRK